MKKTDGVTIKIDGISIIIQEDGEFIFENDNVRKFITPTQEKNIIIKAFEYWVSEFF